MFIKSYWYPEIHKQEVKNQIDKMLKSGMIQNSYSLYSSLIWIVPKKLDASGKENGALLSITGNLMKKLLTTNFPFPTLDILEELGRSQSFTTLDLVNRFHQIEMKKEDIPKTALSVNTGHYEFCRMPFGLKNTPSTFQRKCHIFYAVFRTKSLQYI